MNTSANRGNDRSAIEGPSHATIDPRLDPTVFEVDKPTESDARLVAKERCGLKYELLGKFAVSRTNVGECRKSELGGLLKAAETTRTSSSTPTTCSSNEATQAEVYRFRCK